MYSLSTHSKIFEKIQIKYLLHYTQSLTALKQRSSTAATFPAFSGLQRPTVRKNYHKFTKKWHFKRKEKVHFNQIFDSFWSAKNRFLIGSIRSLQQI